MQPGKRHTGTKRDALCFMTTFSMLMIAMPIATGFIEALSQGQIK